MVPNKLYDDSETCTKVLKKTGGTGPDKDTDVPSCTGFCRNALQRITHTLESKIRPVPTGMASEHCANIWNEVYNLVTTNSSETYTTVFIPWLTHSAALTHSTYLATPTRPVRTTHRTDV